MNLTVDYSRTRNYDAGAVVVILVVVVVVIPDVAVVAVDVATLTWCHFRPTTIRQLLWLAQKRWHSHLQMVVLK